MNRNELCPAQRGTSHVYCWKKIGHGGPHQDRHDTWEEPEIRFNPELNAKGERK